MKNTQFVVLIFVLIQSTAFAQRIDNTASFRNVPGERYIRLHYDNDFWGKTDYYYTQGYSMEIVNPLLRKNPASKILLRLKKGQAKYGLAFEHYGFTPTSIKSHKILQGDRPFAGVIILKSFSISTDTATRQRLNSTLSTGMIGPAAFAGRMQATIHRWTGDQTPYGWEYQIQNDIVLNYELAHEKELFNVPNIVSINTNFNVRLGTLSDKLQTGLTLTLGRFHSPFLTSKSRRLSNFQLYAYGQPMVSLVGYDASMQGGIFNQSSPHTINSADIKRLTFQNNFGVVVSVWKFYAEYYRTYLSKEFETGKGHLWGGVKFGMSF